MSYFSIIIFVLSLFLLFTKRNFLFVLFGLELLLLAVSLNFLSASFNLSDVAGLNFIIILFSLAASDSALGLALLLNFYTVPDSRILNSSKKPFVYFTKKLN